MAKTKAHAKRNEASASNECVITMSYYTQHYQDDQNNRADAGKDNKNMAMSEPNMQYMEPCDFVAREENPTVHNQMQKEDAVACDSLPEWRASWSSHQPSYHPHHMHDIHLYTESHIHPNPPLCVYYRKRRKKIVLGHAAPLPHAQSIPNTLTKRSGKVGRKKMSAFSSRKGEEKICNVKEVTREYKAGDMVLRQTVSRVKRNKAYPKGKCTTCKGLDNSSASIHETKKNKLRPKRDYVMRGSTATRRGTKFKRSGTPSKAIRKLQRAQTAINSPSIHKCKKSSRLSARLSQMKTSEAIAQESDIETCHKVVEEDDEDIATSSTKPKRKKHRPKVRSERPKAPRMARGVGKSTKGKVRFQKRGKKPLKKRGRPKGSQRKNRDSEGKDGKRVSKKRKTLPSQGLYVVSGCPEFFNIIPCSQFHGNNFLPSIQDTKEALIFAKGNILCLHDPLMARDNTQHAAEASSSASNELSTLGGNNNQLALAQEQYCPPASLNNNGQIVLYDQRREMVLFKLPKHFKKVRAKVPIGAENERVWPLLALGGIPSDFEDPQFWEKERELMKERVMNFILKMHEVQGDRRFSPWKGSVLDSVVGAFLTQNVSDHLSSSAFMSIASRFPPLQKEYTSDDCQVEIETNAGSCLNDMQTGTTMDNLVHVRGLHDSSTLCDESAKKGDNIAAEGAVQGTCAQTEVKSPKKVPWGVLSEKDQAKSNNFKITKQGSTQDKSSKVTATSASTSKGTNSLPAKRTHNSKLKPQTTPKALKSPKKRRLSHISGIERAHIEENLNARKNNSQDWESMRKQTLDNPSRHEKRMAIHTDSVDWEAVRHSNVEDLAKAIKERGMHHVLSGRIKAFLKTLEEEHGSTDLEWLRKLSPEDARAYLMSIHGLNVKSTECIRLLTLHHVAFPVDVNVGRVCVRLGWVPIEPLPEQLQLHLLELYPLQETIQKYLWPRLCTLDQKTLYEFHYQLITFGKVFCTKSKPNCHACPMRDDCKHFASAYASAKLLLTGPEEESKSECLDPSAHPFATSFEDMGFVNHADKGFTTKTIFSEVGYSNDCYEEDAYVKDYSFSIEETPTHEEIREDEDIHEEEIMDLEDFYIYKDQRDFTEELLTSVDFLQSRAPSNEHIDCKVLNNLGSLSSCPPPCRYSPSPCKYSGGGCCHCPLKGKEKAYHDDQCSDLHSNATSPSQQNIVFEEAATTAIIAYPMGQHKQLPQLKRVSPLRTIHYVYEIPDMHPLLQKVEPRRKDDPSSYLLVIWSPGEIPQSKEEVEELCKSCPSSQGNPNEIVLSTLLIPCRTALQGSFPLNGTYFQVNEVFADHESSLEPFEVPRALIWQLQRRFVYFGTSVTQIFRGLTRDEIKECFSNGYICVRGFDCRSRSPKLLVCKLHFSKGREQYKKSLKGEN